MIFKKILKMIFERKFNQRKEAKEIYSYFSFVYYFSTFLLNLFFPFQRVILHIPQPLTPIIYIIKF